MQILVTVKSERGEALIQRGVASEARPEDVAMGALRGAVIAAKKGNDENQDTQLATATPGTRSTEGGSGGDGAPSQHVHQGNGAGGRRLQQDCKTRQPCQKGGEP